MQREQGVASVVKLASNESPFPPMPGALAAMADAAAGVLRYPERDWDLKSAIAAHVGAEPEEILTGAGIDSLIGMICSACLGPGDSLVMGWPSFISWRQRALVQGAAFVGVDLAADGSYDLDAVLAAVDERTKLVVIVSPNNPTGGAVRGADLADFIGRLPEHVLPILDEAYFEYLDGEHDGRQIQAQHPRLVVARTFSKAYALAGLRVGYIVADPDLCRELSRVRNAFDVNAIAQAAAIASLADAAEHLAPRVEMIRAERAALVAGLERLGLAPLPSAANFCFVDVGAERAPAINEALLRRGVIIRPAGPFGAPGGLRITVGWPDERERVLHAMEAALAETA